MFSLHNESTMLLKLHMLVKRDIDKLMKKIESLSNAMTYPTRDVGHLRRSESMEMLGGETRPPDEDYFYCNQLPLGLWNKSLISYYDALTHEFGLRKRKPKRRRADTLSSLDEESLVDKMARLELTDMFDDGDNEDGYRSDLEDLAREEDSFKKRKKSELKRSRKRSFSAPSTTVKRTKLIEPSMLPGYNKEPSPPPTSTMKKSSERESGTDSSIRNCFYTPGTGGDSPFTPASASDKSSHIIKPIKVRNHPSTLAAIKE